MNRHRPRRKDSSRKKFGNRHNTRDPEFKPPLTATEPIRFQFVDTDNSYTKAKKAFELEQQATTKSSRLAGDMYIELASLTDDITRKADLIARAQKNWQQTLESSPVLNHETLRAGIQLAHANTYHNILLYDKTPPLEETQSIHLSLVDLGKECALTLNAGNVLQSAKPAMIGAASELSVLLLLHRFSLHTENDEWAIVPSFLSEDTGSNPRLRQNDFNRAWDISIYSQYFGEAPPSLSYKLQIKTSSARQLSEQYPPDISVVHTLNDLDLRDPSTRRRSNFGLTNVLEESYDELYAPTDHAANFARRTLDLRTEKLLEILG